MAMQNTRFSKVKLIFCFYRSNQIFVELHGHGSLRPISKNQFYQKFCCQLHLQYKHSDLELPLPHLRVYNLSRSTE